jgi:site-specific DNA recombinase
MTSPNAKQTTTGPTTMRCAIYTRKSTEEGLEQEFNSLDAQRESAEAFIASQRHEGWTCLPERYDDGGYTGGNLDRPALARLLADIGAGQVQVVVVYKVDRLSRSLLDFAKMMETFDKHSVSFVSVTQQFNTATSMGRLVLHVLLSFAQFEREIISERTRDKIAAARRKGKWSGGHPLLGYDVDPRGSKLVVNEAEADQVRAIFALYLEHHGLIPVIQELARRGWVNKRWVTRKGRVRGGRVFTKTSLYQVLTNVAYVGKVKHKSDVHAGEHAAIVDEEVWRSVQDTLRRNGAATRDVVPNRFGAFLKGLLRCASCHCAMTPSTAKRGKTRRYRYYVCTNAQKCGWSACPSKAVPAGEIERFVLERIAEFAKKADAWEAALVQADAAQQPGARNIPDGTVLAQTLSKLPSVWSGVRPDVQGRLIALAVEGVDYGGGQGKVAIHFHPIGIVKLAEALIRHNQEARS